MSKRYVHVSYDIIVWMPVLVLGLSCGLPITARGQTAYFSLEGETVAVGDQHNFLFNLTRGVGSTENLAFITYTHSGGVNSAGDFIGALGFDSDLRLYDGVGVLHGQDDESGPGLDAVLTWDGDDTPLNPDPLASGGYRLNHQEFGNTSTGLWAVDLVGPADAMVFSGVATTGSGTFESLKFGTTGGGTAVYNHGGTVNLSGPLVVAATGNAELNVIGGTLTVSGLTQVQAGGSVNIDGGTFYANGNMTLNGGSLSRSSGSFLLGAGDGLTATGSGQVSFTGGLMISNNNTYSMIFGSDLSSTSYIDVGAGSDGELVVDGYGSSLTTGNVSSFWGYSGGTANVTIRSGATATINGLNLRIAQGTTTSSGYLRIESGADMTANCNIYLAGDGPAGGTGSLVVTDTGSTLTQTGSHTLTIGHASDGTGTLTVTSSGVYNTGAGMTTVNATGQINVNTGGLLYLNGDVLVDGGTVNTTGSGLQLAAGKTLTVSNDGQVNFSGNYNVNGGSTFNIDSGADLTCSTYIDVGGASAGTLIIDGAGSTITTHSISYYGSNGGIGNVRLSNGAIAYYDNPLRVSQGNVAGTSGVLDVQSDADVNLYGQLTISSAGPIGGSGEVNVTGAGTTFVQSGPVGLTIGHDTNGTGILKVTDYAHFSTGTDMIEINATGTVEISGGGILYANGNVVIDGGTLSRPSGGLFLLDAGKTLSAYNNGQVDFAGAYTIRDGTVFTLESGSDLSSGSYIDIGHTTAGTLTVDGPGSSLTIDGQSYWGTNGGTGLVTLSNEASANLLSIQLAQGTTAGTSGTFNIESGADAQVQGDISLAVSGGSAAMTITGAGSTMTQTGAWNLTIGHAFNGTAELLVTKDAVYTHGSGTTTIHPTGSMTVETDGAFNSLGGIVINGGTLELNEGTIQAHSLERAGGTLAFNDGRLVIDGGAFDPNAAFYYIDGPTSLEMPTLVLTHGATAPGMAGELRIGDDYRGGLQILHGTTLDSSSVYIGHDATGKGSALVDGTGSVWNITGTDLRVGFQGIGQLTVSDQAVINAGDDLSLGSLDDSHGTVLITTGAQVNVNTRVFVCLSGTGIITVDNGGTLVSNGEVHTGFDSTLNVTGPGSWVDAHSGCSIGGSPSMPYGQASLNLSDHARMDIGSILRIWDHGTVNLSGGTLTADTIRDISGGVFNFTGGVLHVNTYEGSLVNNGGTVAPGLSPGLTQVTEDYTQSAGALQIELAGSAGVAGKDFDRLNVAGDVDLDGTLAVYLYDGFIPALGDGFDVVTFGNKRYGVFDKVLAPALPGLGLNLRYMPNAVRLVTQLDGDLNGDGFVGIADLNIVLGNWNLDVTAGIWLLGDPSGDGFIGIADLNIVLGNWNAGTPPDLDVNIPEPTCAVLLGAGFVVTCRLRHRV